MKRIWISTIFRQEKNRVLMGDLGYIYCVDWDTRTILNDPRGVEPRYNTDTSIGRSHGCRGITFHNNEIYIASSGGNIAVFDRDSFVLKRELDLRPNVDCLHQIRNYSDKIYLSSTANDSLVILENDKIISEKNLLDDIRVSAKGDQYEKITEHVIKRMTKPNRPNPSLIPGGDNLHFNSITLSPQNELWVVFCGASTIYNLSKHEIFFQDHDRLHAPHDLIFMNRGVVTNLAPEKQSVFISYDKKEYKIFNDNTSWFHNEDTVLNDYGFARGADYKNNRLFIGNSPTIVKEFNEDLELVSEFRISEDPHETIFDIRLDERDW